MIKFFRKIRQNLLTENKFSKYLIYAIGEIILVVIGILIALSINKSNEDRKSKIEERAILEAVKTEFEINRYFSLEVSKMAFEYARDRNIYVHKCFLKFLNNTELVVVKI